MDPPARSRPCCRAPAVDLVAEIRRLDARIPAADKQITAAVTATGSILSSLYGIGALMAGKILAHVATVHRFASPATFASFNGTAPIEVSSGDVVRHLLPRR